MNNFIQKNNTGTLFLNERKTETHHPDYTGKAIINGKAMWVSAWIKTAKNGKRFISISVQEPFKQMKEAVKPQEIEDTRITYDEGYGEPDSTLNTKIDNFVEEHKTKDEDTEDVPF